MARMVRRNNGYYYYQHGDRRKALGTKKRTLATRRWAEVCRIVENGDWPRGVYPWATGNVKPVLYAEAVEKYTTDTRRAATQRKQLQVLLKAFCAYGSGKIVSEITTADIEKHKALRLRTKRENTVASDLRHLSAFFNWCVRMGWAKANPVKGVRKPKGKSQQRPAYTKAEAKRLVAAADSEETQDLVLVALHCGLRNMELAHLQKQDVDLRGKTLTIRDKAKADGFVWRAKSLKSERTVQLNKHALGALRRRCEKKGALDLLFPSARGGVDKHLLRRIERIRDKARVPDATLHGFRHTFITWLVRGKTDLKTAQELAGHESIETTARYLHTDDATKRKAVRGLE